MGGACDGHGKVQPHSAPSHPNPVCLAVWRNHHMRTVTNYFIVNLSLADVLVTAICLPASLLVDITESWLFGHALCKVIPYLQVSYTLNLFSRGLRNPQTSSSHGLAPSFLWKTIWSSGLPFEVTYIGPLSTLQRFPSWPCPMTQTQLHGSWHMQGHTQTCTVEQRGTACNDTCRCVLFSKPCPGSKRLEVLSGLGLDA